MRENKSRAERKDYARSEIITKNVVEVFTN